MGIDARIFVRTMKQITDDEIKRLSFEIGCAFGAQRFFRWRNHHNISRIKRIEQDGPPEDPDPGETMLEVHVSTRYYGPGYERGDLPFLVMVAEWLERRIPECEVWYGGDSSGVCAAPFGPEERSEMLDHFASPHGRDYFSSGNPLFSGAIAGSTDHPICKLCNEPMPQYGYGGMGSKRGMWSCGGCGSRVKRTETGELVEMEANEKW